MRPHRSDGEPGVALRPLSLCRRMVNVNEQKERVLRYGVPSTFGVEGLEPMGNDYFFARYFDHWKTVHLRDEYAPFIANAKRLTLTDPLPELFNPMLEAYLGGTNVHAPLLIGAVLNNPLKGPQAAPDDADGAMKKPPPRRVVRVILTSPTHPSAADGFDDGGSPIQVEALLMKTLDLWTQRAQRSKDDGSLSLIEITTVHTKLIRSHATMTEQGAYVLPRFYTAKQSSWNPCYFFNEATQFYRSLVADLEWLTKNYSAPDGRPRFSMLSMAEYFVGLANPAFSLIHAAGVPTHLHAIENHDIVSLIHGSPRPRQQGPADCRSPSGPEKHDFPSVGLPL